MREQTQEMMNGNVGVFRGIQEQKYLTHLQCLPLSLHILRLSWVQLTSVPHDDVGQW